MRSRDQILLLTATPHKGDPENFSLFLQLLDADAYADVKSIREAMERRRAPFYLRRTKEAMVHFPERQPDGMWAAKKIFTKRIPHTVDFQIDGTEFELYRDVTRFVKQQSALAAAQGDDPRARAVGFLMSLYQRRLASSTAAMWHSLENRARRLGAGLKRAQELARQAPLDLPDPEEFEEMEESERDRLEELLEAVTLARNAEQVRAEIQELQRLAEQAQRLKESGTEAKLSRLQSLLHEEGFFRDSDKRLLIFTEFKDTLDYLLECLTNWGFRVGCIHGGMKSGSRNESGTRLYTEQQFKDGEIQILVATEAAGEGINLQCCHVLFNYDISVPRLSHTFEPGRTPLVLRQYESQADWKLPTLATRYSRCSTDRDTAEKHNLEWVTPGHPLFEAVRRHTLTQAREIFAKGACFYSLEHDAPARLDFYRARVVDGLGQVAHERLFAVEISANGQPCLREPGVLGNFLPANAPGLLPPVTELSEVTDWLGQCALMPFLEEVRAERLAEVGRVAEHVELSLTELLQKTDEEIGKAAADVEQNLPGAEGRLAQAEDRHAKLRDRRERRRQELQRQKSLSLQAVERITSVLILPHPERNAPEVRRLQPDFETEAIAMRVVMESEQALGRQVYDVHEKNLGYDITSLDLNSGELRLIEVKGIGDATGTILLTPNERRVAEDRRDCYWLYVVTNCNIEPQLQEPIKDPARFEWHEVTKVAHYYLSVDALTKPMRVREPPSLYERRGE